MFYSLHSLTSCSGLSDTGIAHLLQGQHSLRYLWLTSLAHAGYNTFTAVQRHLRRTLILLDAEGTAIGAQGPLLCMY